MSNQADELTKVLAEASLMDKKIQEVKAKKLELDERRINIELGRVKEQEKNMELSRSSNFGLMSEQEVDKVIKDSDEYIEAARNKTRFINADFDDAVPYFRKNLILIGGATGNGKSTIVANIVRSTIAQKGKDGQLKKVLVITNEQLKEDFYNCVTCQIKGWEYVNHHEFSDEQRKEFGKYTKFLAGSGLVTIIDNNYNGATGQTTTVEGLKTIFDNLIREKQWYDVILVDYYQNFSSSSENPKVNEWEAQRMVCKLLDQYKNAYPAPIVLFAQSKPQAEEEHIPFKFRLEGTKAIQNVATCVIEIIADRDNMRTEWIIHKSRFQKGIVGKSFWTGYENGQFVPYDDAFKEKIRLLQQKRQEKLIDQVTGTDMNKKAENKDGK